MENGFPAKKALDAIPGDEGKRVRARMLALAQRFADFGKLPGNHGHRLSEPFADIYEFKPCDYRVMAFRVDIIWHVTNVAKKASPKVQNRDYQIAENMRLTFSEGSK